MGLLLKFLEDPKDDGYLHLFYCGQTTKGELRKRCKKMRVIEETVVLYTDSDGNEIVYIEDFAYPHSVRNAFIKLAEERGFSEVRIHITDAIPITHRLRGTLLGYTAT